ncbi:MAG: hypothetical protein J1E81_06065 [Eubacterium sp.]|nr:hypothetical protein [Eubacterium sp.]
MTPLEEARLREKNGGCDTCKKCVTVRGVFYCEVNGKLLLPSLISIGHCMHNPSDFVRSNNG